MTLQVDLETVGLQPLELLGTGADGVVVKAVNIKTRKQYAVKIVSISKGKIKYFEREALNTMRLLKHPNILPTKGYHKLSPEYGMIVMEYIPHGDVMAYFIRKTKLSESKVRKFFKQMCKAVEVCHLNSIAHLDIKPENFLYDRSTRTLKLCDFYRSFDWENDKEDAELLNNLTSLKYQPPELRYKKKRCDLSKVDVWALGISLFGLLFGYFPFQADANADSEMLVFDFIRFENFLEMNDRISENAKSLLRTILVANPLSRPSVSVILEHPFFLSTKHHHHHNNNHRDDEE